MPFICLRHKKPFVCVNETCSYCGEPATLSVRSTDKIETIAESPGQALLVNGKRRFYWNHNRGLVLQVKARRGRHGIQCRGFQALPDMVETLADDAAACRAALSDPIVKQIVEEK